MNNAFLFPLIYCLGAGLSWTLLFRKRFDESLAPALFLQILVVTFAGVAHLTLTAGLRISIVIICIMLAAGIMLQIRRKTPVRFFRGILPFLVFFVLAWYLNEGKRFMYFDEFQQWGMFLKECLRTDHLYAEATLSIQHLDYVPAITVFEVMWTKLCGRYLEMDAYRAVQVLCFSMILPIFQNILSSLGKQKSAAGILRKLLVFLLVYASVLFIPVIFNTADGFLFYHSLYLDYLQGLLVFCCIHNCLQKNEPFWYMILTLSIDLSVLVLSKQTSIAFLPMIVLFYAVYLRLFSSDHQWKKFFLGFSTAILPLLLWFRYRSYTDSYVSYQTESAAKQTYSSFTPSSLIQLLKGSELSDAQMQIKEAYQDALLHTDVLLKGSYVQVLLIIILLMVLIGFLARSVKRKKVFLTALWTAIAGAVYAYLMYFLYQTAFDSEEALILASYTRYMNVFLVTAIYLLLDLYFFSDIWKKVYEIPCMIILASFLFAISTQKDVFSQMEPGTLTNDEEIADQYENFADYFNESTEENSSILIVTRSAMPYMNLRLRYYCMPRGIKNVSPGPAVNDQDNFSEDISQEDFVQLVSEYDYLYLNLLDQGFVSAYTSTFEDPSEIVSATIFKSTVKDGKIDLQKVGDNQ